MSELEQYAGYDDLSVINFSLCFLLGKIYEEKTLAKLLG